MKLSLWCLIYTANFTMCQASRVSTYTSFPFHHFEIPDFRCCSIYMRLNYIVYYEEKIIQSCHSTAKSKLLIQWLDYLSNNDDHHFFSISYICSGQTQKDFSVKQLGQRSRKESLRLLVPCEDLPHFISTVWCLCLNTLTPPIFLFPCLKL